jgi:hypothetical protein
MYFMKEKKKTYKDIIFVSERTGKHEYLFIFVNYFSYIQK